MMGGARVLPKRRNGKYYQGPVSREPQKTSKCTEKKKGKNPSKEEKAPGGDSKK